MAVSLNIFWTQGFDTLFSHTHKKYT